MPSAVATEVEAVTRADSPAGWAQGDSVVDLAEAFLHLRPEAFQRLE